MARQCRAEGYGPHRHSGAARGKGEAEFSNARFCAAKAGLSKATPRQGRVEHSPAQQEHSIVQQREAAAQWRSAGQGMVERSNAGAEHRHGNVVPGRGKAAQRGARAKPSEATPCQGTAWYRSAVRGYGRARHCLAVALASEGLSSKAKVSRSEARRSKGSSGKASS